MRKTSDSRSRNSILEETQAALTDLSGDQVQAQTGMRRQELDSINRDQGRIRENMKTLKGSAEEKDLVQRYTRQLNSQEDRLATLNKETAICKTRITGAAEAGSHGAVDHH
jgi:lipid II:glycine glycyltransferase (peptidoglycan interpeptide bridge formation enzyme)